MMMRIPVLLLVVASCVNACKPAPGFVFLSFEEVMYRADLVLYGKDLHHTVRPDPEWSWTNRTDSVFGVYCVLKSTRPLRVPATITIRQIEPRTTCETSPPEVGQDYIVMLRRLRRGVYEWKPVKELHSAKYPADQSHLDGAMKVCGFQSPSLPRGAPYYGKSCPPISQDACFQPMLMT